MEWELDWAGKWERNFMYRGSDPLCSFSYTNKKSMT